MPTIKARKQANGTTRYTAIVRIRRGGAILHRESRTFTHRSAALSWAKHREVALEDPSALTRVQHGAPVQQLLDQCRLCDPLSPGKLAHEFFHVRSDTTLNEHVGWHVSDRVTTAAGRLSCIHSFLAPILHKVFGALHQHSPATQTSDVCCQSHERPS